MSLTQHITYNEWLPLVLGLDFMEELDIGPINYGYSNRYNPKVINAILNRVSFDNFIHKCSKGQPNCYQFLRQRCLQIRTHSHPGHARVSNMTNEAKIVAAEKILCIPFK